MRTVAIHVRRDLFFKIKISSIKARLSQADFLEQLIGKQLNDMACCPSSIDKPEQVSNVGRF